jgi:hypothetical protein
MDFVSGDVGVCDSEFADGKRILDGYGRGTVAFALVGWWLWLRVEVIEGWWGNAFDGGAFVLERVTQHAVIDMVPVVVRCVLLHLAVPIKRSPHHTQFPSQSAEDTAAFFFFAVKRRRDRHSFRQGNIVVDGVC